MLIVLVATVHIVAIACPRQPAVAMACHILASAAAAAAVHSPASAAGHSLASAVGRKPRPAWAASRSPELAASHSRRKPVPASVAGRKLGLAWAAIRSPEPASRSLQAASHTDRMPMATEPCHTAAAAARAYRSPALAAARIHHKLKAVIIQAAADQAGLEAPKLEQARQVGPTPMVQAVQAVKPRSVAIDRSFGGHGRTCNH